MATEVGAVEFDLTSRTADAQRFRAGRHGLTHLMRPHESGFVLDVELTREREHAVARDFVTERDNCKQVGPQWQLVMGEQRAGGDRDIAAARLAAPARPVRRPWAGIGRWCMETGKQAGLPPPMLHQAARTEIGFAVRIIRFSAATARDTSPCCAGKLRARSFEPMIAL